MLSKLGNSNLLCPIVGYSNFYWPCMPVKTWIKNRTAESDCLETVCLCCSFFLISFFVDSKFLIFSWSMWSCLSQSHVSQICNSWSQGGKGGLVLAMWKPTIKTLYVSYHDFCNSKLNAKIFGKTMLNSCRARIHVALPDDIRNMLWWWSLVDHIFPPCACYNHYYHM